jgi:hypothetical protein
MSATQDKQLQSRAAALRNLIAANEANVDQLRAKLAIIEAKLSGGPVPLSGLEILWQTALPMARTRSSKQQCRIEWNRIPQGERPRVEDIISALKIWNRCEEWKKDGNAYVPGLHRWIKARQWENLPEVSTRDGLARYRSTPKPVPQTAPEDAATPEDIAEIFKAVKRMNS